MLYIYNIRIDHIVHKIVCMHDARHSRIRGVFMYNEYCMYVIAYMFVYICYPLRKVLGHTFSFLQNSVTKRETTNFVKSVNYFQTMVFQVLAKGNAQK